MEQAITKVKRYRAIDWCWLICIISFVGFCVENIWNVITSGQLDNRNMHLPFILGYGLAILGIYLFFGTPTDNNGLFNLPNKSNIVFQYVSYIICVTLFISIWEILIGHTVQYLSGISYWDFSDVPLHITKYTSILTSIGYSIIITLFMRYIFDKIMSWLNQFDESAFKLTGYALFALLTIDMFASYGAMITNNNYNLIWCIRLFPV